MQKLMLFFALGYLLSCGQLTQNRTSELHQMRELLDNDPLKLQCFGLSKKAPEPLAVEFDDQAEIRLCAALQKDGHLGFDIRYRADYEHKQNVLVQLSVRNDAGREAEAILPLSLQTLTHTYDIYISSGCVVSGVDGCLTYASEPMQHLLTPVKLQDDGLSYEPFTLELAFIEVRDAKNLRPQVASNPRFSLRIPAL